MANADDADTCDHEPCHCRVADDETHIKDDRGRIYCSEGCLNGEGCDHPGCSCGEV